MVRNAGPGTTGPYRPVLRPRECPKFDGPNKIVHLSPEDSPTSNYLDCRKLVESSRPSVFGARKFDRPAGLGYVRGRFLAPRLHGAIILVSRSVPS